MTYTSKPAKDKGYKLFKGRLKNITRTLQQIVVAIDRPRSEHSTPGYSSSDYVGGDGSCSGDCAS